jgi:hypothetical protein
VRAFGIAAFAAAAVAAGAVDAHATSCGESPVVFRGGEYTMVAGSAGVSVGPEAGTAAYPTVSSSEDSCVDYRDVEARRIRGVSPLAGIVFPGWGVFAAGQRCSHYRGSQAVECLQVPLRFGSRQYRPVEVEKGQLGEPIGRGWLGNARVEVVSFGDVDQRRVVGIAGRPRERYVADSLLCEHQKS